MSGGNKASGYTILEVMIVLAISGMMFVMAASFVNGRQAQTAFTQGVNETVTQLDSTIQQIQDGQYSDIPLSCTYTPGNTNPNQPGAVEQGTNIQCVFLGKFVHYTVDNNPADDEATKYEILPVAGGRIDSTGKTVVDLLAANPTVVNALVTQHTTPQSLDVTKVTVTPDGGGSPQESYILGLMQGQGTLDMAGSLENGAQGVSLYYVNGATKNLDTATAKARIKNTSNIQRAAKAEICLESGDRKAIVNLGIDNGQLSASAKFYGDGDLAPCP